MEQILRLEVANQKSLGAVFDVLSEKSMRRFGMVAAWHYKRIGKGFQLYTWQEKAIAAEHITYWNPNGCDPWMTVWSTAFKSGSADDMWRELELFARDYNRDTVLVSTAEDGSVFYRFCSSQAELHAFIHVTGACIQAEHPEAFYRGLLKKFKMQLPPDFPPADFSNQNEACSYIEKMLRFAPQPMPSLEKLLALKRRGKLKDPFESRPYVIAPEYLAYDPKAEYQKLLVATEEYLGSLGYRRSGTNFYRILNDGAYMECLNFQKGRFQYDRRHDTSFTVNVQFGSASDAEIDCWRTSDFRGHVRAKHRCFDQRIGTLVNGRDTWYQLFPGADTPSVINQFLADLHCISDFLEKQRESQ